MTVLCYNSNCPDEQNNGALYFLKPSTNVKFTGKAPSISRTRVLAVRLDNDSAYGGRFVMAKYKGGNWHNKVYRRNLSLTKEQLDNWNKIRKAVLYRDNLVCLRCDKKFKAFGDLSVHHLIPRSNGGSDDMTNLVTLCNACHDIVEIDGLQTRAEIIGSYDDISIIILPITNSENEESFTRPEWHKYVYGGVKHVD